MVEVGRIDDLVAAPCRMVILNKRDADEMDELLQYCMQPEGSEGQSGREASSSSRWIQDDVHDLLALLSVSPDHLWHFLDTLGVRVERSRDWHEALKGLLLLHMHLRRCNQSQTRAAIELLLAGGGRGSHRFDLHAIATDFRSASSSNHSQSSSLSEASLLVRRFASFLVARVTCAVCVQLWLWVKDGGETAGSEGRRQGEGGAATATVAATGLSEQYWGQQADGGILEQVMALQELQSELLLLVEAAVGVCEREGPVEGVWVVREMLELVLRDSFDIYTGINYALIELVERLPALPRDKAFSALSAFRVTAKQSPRLAAAYERLGALRIGSVARAGGSSGGGSERQGGVNFPQVVAMGEDYISSIQEQLQAEAGEGPNQRGTFSRSPSSSSAAPTPRGLPNQIVLLPSPLPSTRPFSAAPPTAGQQAQHPSPVYAQYAQSQFDANAHALFGTAPPARPHGHPPAPAPGAFHPHHHHSQGHHHQHQQQQQQGGLSWEVALDASHGAQLLQNTNHINAIISLPIQPPSPQFSGGFDQLLLDSLYEAAAAQRAAYHAMHDATSSSAVTHAQDADPFAASLAVPPPPYVQMAMRAQQQMAMLLERRMMAHHTQMAAYMASHGMPSTQVQGGNLMGPQHPYMAPHMNTSVFPTPSSMVTATTGPGQYNWQGVGVRYGNVLVPY